MPTKYCIKDTSMPINTVWSKRMPELYKPIKTEDAITKMIIKYLKENNLCIIILLWLSADFIIIKCHLYNKYLWGSKSNIP